MPLSNRGVSLRTPLSPGSAETGSTLLMCVVLGVDGNIAQVRDQLGGNRQVSISRMLGKGVAPPAAGETWGITSIFGAWMFAFQVNPPYDQYALESALASYTLNTDSRLSDARRPTGTAGGVLTGTYPNPTLLAPSQTLIGAAGAPTFQNSWQNFGGEFQSCGYYLDAQNQVHLFGRAQQPTLTSLTNSLLFTLPAGFLPAASVLYSVGCGNGNLVAQIKVQSTGTVTMFSSGTTSGGAIWVSLDGCTFLATH